MMLSQRSIGVPASWVPSKYQETFDLANGCVGGVTVLVHGNLAPLSMGIPFARTGTTWRSA